MLQTLSQTEAVGATDTLTEQPYVLNDVSCLESYPIEAIAGEMIYNLHAILESSHIDPYSKTVDYALKCIVTEGSFPLKVDTNQLALTPENARVRNFSIQRLIKVEEDNLNRVLEAYRKDTGNYLVNQLKSNIEHIVSHPNYKSPIIWNYPSNWIEQ